MRKILYITPSDITDIVSKGVQDLILDRNEGGFFDFCLTLIPFGRTNLQYNIRKDNLIIQYGWKTGINALDKYKITKIIGTVIILFKLFFIFPRILKKEKIDIIRATDPYLMGLLGVFYSKILKIPLVVSIHSDYDKRFNLDGPRGSFTIFGSRKLAKKLESFVYKKADKILPIRNYLKKRILNEYKLPENKVEVFPHSLDFDKFEKEKFINIYKKFNISIDKKIISFVGRLTRENYVYDIIKIIEKLTKIRKDFIFLIVGDGVEAENLKKIVLNKKIEDNIIFTGFQEKQIVINIRKQSYISLCLMGGFSLIEACAAGRPVIAYDVEWHYELIKNDKTGYLIKEGNIDDVVKKIDLLFNNNKLADKLGKNAKELAFKRHNWDAVIKIKQNIYKRILDE